MWSGRRRRERPARAGARAGPTAGFTLIEVLVAVLIAAMMGGALVQYFSVIRRGAMRVDDTLAAWEVARAVAAGVPQGKELSPGVTVGAAGPYAWRLELSPMAAVGPAAVPVADGTAPDESPEADPAAPERWAAFRLSLDVTGPRGGRAKLETVRVGRDVGGEPE